MIFGRSQLADARGAILAHSLKTVDGILHKGALIGDQAVNQLQAAGYETITVARLEPGDVTEEAAAAIMGNLLLSPGLRRSEVTNGRVNLFATADGLLRIDAGKITQLNLVDESIALATLPDYTVVRQGDMVATLKIIPFAVSCESLAREKTVIAEGTAALQVECFQHLAAGLIITTLPQIKPATIANTIAATQTRITAHGGTLLTPLELPHDAARIAAGIAQLLEAGADMILIAGASAVTDRLDTAPQGILQAGGAISHFGMPVDPGNLICFGSIANRPAIVLPGCARSPALNGIDWVLDRLFAGEPIGAREIAAMGAGGLLKEIKSRPAPREPKAPAATAKRNGFSNEQALIQAVQHL